MLKIRYLFSIHKWGDDCGGIIEEGVIGLFGGGNTDWTDLRRFALIPGRSSSGAGPVEQISFISQISVISVRSSREEEGNTDWTDLRRFALIPGRPSSGAGPVEQISGVSVLLTLTVPAPTPTPPIFSLL
jgi:hypothetical protein